VSTVTNADADADADVDEAEVGAIKVEEDMDDDAGADAAVSDISSSCVQSIQSPRRLSRRSKNRAAPPRIINTARICLHKIGHSSRHEHEANPTRTVIVYSTV
jgi:hypothetical protein